MANEKRLIDADELVRFCENEIDKYENGLNKYERDYVKAICVVKKIARTFPAVSAVEVVHGRWEQEIGDLHYGGVLYYCSVCNKLHFVKARYSLITLSSHEELFSKPNYCPNCGAKMDGGGIDG